MTHPVTRREALQAPAVPVLLALALFAVPRLALLTRYPPWQDELWTLGVLQRDFPTMLRWVVADQTHPPFFYALAWAWRRAGPDALWWMRLLPALMGIGLAVPLVALCRVARLEFRASVLAVALCAASPWLVFYSLELRDYGLYAALATASLAAWMHAREAGPGDRTPWRVLLAVNIALVYSHYFGWLVIVAEGADALFFSRGRLAAFARNAVWTALAFVPWVAVVGRRAVRVPRGLDMVSWIPRPGPGDLLDPFRASLGVSPWIALDLGLLVLAGGVIAWALARERRSMLAPVVLAATLPVVLTFAASVAGPRSVWVVRYLLAAGPPFLILLAMGITSLLQPRTLALGFALWPASLLIWHAARRDDKVPYDAILAGIATRDFSTGGTSRRSTPVYVLDYEQGGPLAWASAHSAAPRDVSTLSSVDSVHAPRAWVLWNEARPPAGPTPTARLVRNGYRIEQEFSVRGMDDSVVAIAVRRRP
ncbi:MAG: hypothetical protein ACHQQ3_09660 [Gemmatimonadales bacterium]